MLTRMYQGQIMEKGTLIQLTNLHVRAKILLSVVTNHISHPPTATVKVLKPECNTAGGCGETETGEHRGERQKRAGGRRDCSSQPGSSSIIGITVCCNYCVK